MAFQVQGRQFNQGSAGVPEGFLQMIWPHLPERQVLSRRCSSLTSDLRATLQAQYATHA